MGYLPTPGSGTKYRVYFETQTSPAVWEEAAYQRDPVFAGSGANDILVRVHNTPITGQRTLEIVIDGEGPDTCKYRIDSGAWTAGVPIDGAYREVQGIEFAFSGTSGHTSGDQWLIVFGCAFVEADTIRFQKSLTTWPTFNFRVFSEDHLFIPAVDTPVKLTHDDLGEIFGGKVVQTKVFNEPGIPGAPIHIECECVSWENVLADRLLVLAGIVIPGNQTETFHGDGAVTFFALAHWPMTVRSVQVNGVSQSFGIYGDPSVLWWWGVGNTVVNQHGGTVLGPLDELVISYDAADVESSYTPPTYANMSLGDIVTDLLGHIPEEGFTLSIDDEGPIVDSIAFSIQDTFSSALDSLMKYASTSATAYRYYITPSKVFHLEISGQTRMAPWSIDSGDLSDGNVLIEVSNTTTKEKFADGALVNITNALSPNPFNVVYPGDWQRTSFETTMPVGSIVKIELLDPSLNVVPQTFGPDQTTGVQWWYSVGSTRIEQAIANVDNGVGTAISASTNSDPVQFTTPFAPANGTQVRIGGFTDGWILCNGDHEVTWVSATEWTIPIDSTGFGPPTGTPKVAFPLPSGWQLRVVYIAQTTQMQTYIDAVATAARKAVGGGSGEVDLYLELSNSLPYAIVSGMNLAKNLVDSRNQLSSTVEVTTYRGGLDTGQAISISLPEIGADDTYIIDQVTLSEEARMGVWRILCVAGAVIGDWKTAFKALAAGASGAGGAIGGSSGSTTVGKDFFDVPVS